MVARATPGLHWTLIPATDNELKKDIDDAYDDPEYHAPNNDVRHSETTNNANIRSSTSRLKPLFQSEAKCEDIDMKMFLFSCK